MGLQCQWGVAAEITVDQSPAIRSISCLSHPVPKAVANGKNVISEQAMLVNSSNRPECFKGNGVDIFCKRNNCFSAIQDDAT